MMTSPADPGFGLYVHWPFCLAKCPYCDFNSHVAREIDQAAYRDALLLELRSVATRIDKRPLTSIFFGGGTPSLMAAETVGAIIEAASDLFGSVADVEITLEANPTSVEAERFRAYRAAGVNRVSLGVQALNDADLKFLGRQHSVAEALAALDVARSTFERVSFDLIYARTGQTLGAWEQELGQALALGPDHLSLYQLTIEPQTRFQEWYDAGKLIVPDQDVTADMFDATQALCEAAGRPAYEVSNHAAPGAESRHNLVYWRYGDYVGVGPGAHGRVVLDGAVTATQTHKSPDQWRAQVMETGHGLALADPIDREAQAQEMVLMGMRLSEGISQARYQGLAGQPMAPEVKKALMDQGLLIEDGDRLKATPEGRLVLNHVIGQLV